MKELKLLLCLLFCCWVGGHLSAQKFLFEDTLQHELYDIQVIDATHFIVQGIRTTDPPSIDKILNKKRTFSPNFLAIIDENGKVIEKKEYIGLPSNAILRTVLVKDSLIIAAGKVYDYPVDTTIIVAFNKKLDIKWVAGRQPGEIYKIAPSGNQTFLTCGEVDKDILVMQYTDAGKLIRTDRYPAMNESYWNEGYDLLWDEEKIFIAGSIAQKSQENFGVLCIDLAGKKWFEKSYSDKRSEAALIRKTEGGYMVAGVYDSYKDMGFLVKITEGGDTLFSSLFEGIELNINNIRTASDSLIQLKWGKELGVKPKDMVILPNNELILLCDVSYYSGTVYENKRKKTIGVFHFSGTGEMIRKSIFETDYHTIAKKICIIPGNNLIIMANEDLASAGETFRRGFIYKTTVAQLFGNE